MSAKSLSMRKTREILRLKWDLGLADRQVGRSCSVSPSTVGECVRRAEKAGLTWPLPAQLDDAALEAMLYPAPATPQAPRRSLPPMEEIHRELRRKGVTLQLLWYEYKQNYLQGYQYSQFCHHYRRWARNLDVCLRQEYKAGEKMFLDFAGEGLALVDPETGEVRATELFVAVLGASSYTYAEATLSQQLPCWIKAHVHAFEFFGGVTEILVPDNTRCGVSKACRYEPDLNPTYQDLASHYGCTIIPARPARPRDKAKVEAGVLLAQRWIVAVLRNCTFFSLAEMNQAIHECLDDLNRRKFKKLDASRYELYEVLDKPALKPLPARPYEYAEWKKARVNIDYHIEVEGHYYSVPYQLVREQVDLRLSSTTVEVLYRGRRVVSHARSFQKGAATTVEEHRPKSHRAHLEWTPSRIINWAAGTGPATAALVEQIMKSRPHPEQGYRSCLGIMRLGSRYSQERLEAACARALAVGAYSYKSVKSILSSGLDQIPPSKAHLPAAPRLSTNHPNLRGPHYYQ